jgi:hypothetical protein
MAAARIAASPREPLRCPTMTMRRLAFVTGFCCGYVLGAKAGHDRYDTIVAAARRLADHPAAQGAAGLITAKLSGVLGRPRG